jgi:hypothetical protein
MGPPAPVNSNGTAIIGWSSFTVGAHNVTAIYQGDNDHGFSVSPVWTQVVMSSGTPGNGSITLLTMNPSQTFFRQNAAFLVLVQGPSIIPPPGSVVLLDGNRQIGPQLTLDSSGSAIYRTPLTIGSHSFRAVYLGNSNVSGSDSGSRLVNTSPRPKPR